jgi:hypothetical protein
MRGAPRKWLKWLELVLASAAAALATATGASAYWTEAGTGSGSVLDATLAVPTLTATPKPEAVELSWTAVTPPGSGTVEYFVTRDGGAPSSHCPSSASHSTVTSCTDEPVAIGTHEYKVTAVWRTWTAESESKSAQVTSGPATKLKLEASAATVTAGATDNLTITAQDTGGNTVTSYGGSGGESKTLKFQGAEAVGSHNPTVTNSSGTAVNFGGSTPITFKNGVAVVEAGTKNGQLTLYKAETALLTVEDTVSSIGSSASPLSITVTPAAASSLSLSPETTTPTAGGPDNAAITALDAYGNTATGYTGSHNLKFEGAHTIGSHAPTVTDSSGTARAFGTEEAISFSSGLAFPGSGGASNSGYATNGVIEAIVHSEGVTYIGGSFTEVAPATGPGVGIGAAGGTDLKWARIWGGASKVSAVAPDGSGGFYIGGEFTHVGGVALKNIAHIKSSGEVEASWNPGANNEVKALVVSGQTVYAGGEFASIGGQARNRLAALCATANCDGAGTEAGHVTAWNPNMQSYVTALALSGSTLYAGGLFNGASSVNGSTERNHLASFCTTSAGGCAVASGSYSATNNVTAWNPNANHAVYAMAFQGSTLYAGGSFGIIGGQTRARLAAVCTVANCDGAGTGAGSATAWNPDASGEVDALALSSDGSTLYAGGVFNGAGSVNGSTERNHLAAFCTTGSGGCTVAGGSYSATNNVTAWNPNANGNVQTLALQGSTLYVGGAFSGASSIGGQTRNRLAAVCTAANCDGAGTAAGNATAWNPNASGEVAALAVSGSTVYAGGSFASINSQVRNNLAALNASNEPTAWNPNASGEVAALALSSDGSTLYAGGAFNGAGSVNGSTERNRAAAFCTTGAGACAVASGSYSATNNVAAWNPNVGAGGVSALAISGSTVYAGGGFSGASSVNGSTERNRLAAFDATTGAVTTWNPSASGTVTVLTLSGSTLYAGGYFATVGVGAPTRNHLAAVCTAANCDGAGTEAGRATAWNPNVSGVVFALALSSDGSTLYAGGSFSGASSVNGSTERNDAASFCTTGSGGCTVASGSYSATNNVTAWNPNVSGLVDALALSSDGTRVYAGGLFNGASSVNGNVKRNYLAAFNTTTGAVTEFNPGPNNLVKTLAISGSTLYVGGTFTALETGVASYYASFTIGRMVLYKAETASITVSDGSITNGAGTSVTVGAASAASFTVSTPGEQTANVAFSVTLTALDAYGNTATGYAGAKAIAFSGPANSPSGKSPTYPATTTFTSGVGSNASYKLFDAQTTTLTAKEGSIEGASGSFTVKAAAAKRWAWSHAEVTAGSIESATCLFECTTTNIGNSQKFKAHVSVTDEYGNIESNLGAGHKAEVTQNVGGLGTLTNASAIAIPSAGLAESATVFEYTSPLALEGEGKLTLKKQEGTAYTEATATVKY